MAEVDRKRVAILKRHGVRPGLARIMVSVSRRLNIPLSLIAALLEKESGFRNVWGHDPAPNGGTSHLGGERVSRSDYRAYRKRRGDRGQGGMQGVGVGQLTWYELQDEADRLGGCWKSRANITVAAGHAWKLIRRYGLKDGLRRYNGSGPAAVAYSRDVRERMRKWHERFT